MNEFDFNIIAAVRSDEEFEKAVVSDCRMIFDLSPDIFSLKQKASAAHAGKKKIFIHIDLASGIGKDKNGIIFAQKSGIDGIISTRVNLIKLAREAGLYTVQRFFIVDSHSIDTTVEAVRVSKPHMIEIMPGIIPKAIAKIKSKLDTTLIAGGIIDNKAEVDKILASGASAVSTGSEKLWYK